MRKWGFPRFRRVVPGNEFSRAEPRVLAAPAGLPPECFGSSKQAAEALHGYLVEGWRSLPESRLRELGFESTDNDRFEEECFRHFATLFVDCMNLALDDALQARQRRLEREGA